MYQTIHAVALRTVRHSDRAAILTAWTSEMGRVALLLNDTNTPESRRRRALLMPMSLFEAQVDPRPGRDVMMMRDIRPTIVCPEIVSNPVRSSLAMFMAEVLGRVLRESGSGDACTYAFIRNVVSTLDTVPQKALGNIHLWFLYRLSVVLGIPPDISTYRSGYAFDMANACFIRPGTTAYHPRRVIHPENAGIVMTLSRLIPRNLSRLRLSRDDRAEILDTILHYYTLHHAPLDSLQSLPILHTIHT